MLAVWSFFMVMLFVHIYIYIICLRYVCGWHEYVAGLQSWAHPDLIFKGIHGNCTRKEKEAALNPKGPTA